MIELDEVQIWEKLSSPYGNSEEIPSLLLELSKTFNKEIADEIIWEYIYHQGSVYENTLATIPHLFKIIDESNSIDFELDLIISLGIVLVGFDGSSNLEERIFTNNLDKKVQNRIKKAFFNSIEKFSNKIAKLTPKAKNLDEQSKMYFLVAYLVAKEKHKEAEMFICFSGNDEYVFVCPSCSQETFLWNEENTIKVYSKDPVFNKNQQKLQIELNGDTIDLEWLEKPINKLEINSLKPIIKYFQTTIECYHCGKHSNIFDGIMNTFS